MTKSFEYRIVPNESGNVFGLTRVTKEQLKGGNSIAAFEFIGNYDNLQELVYFIQEELKHEQIVD